ncbi:MAG TPA: heme-binding protein [Burkholderiales bacterium]|nr:heme-binding protein [Burkholderiales bacterium]
MKTAILAAALVSAPVLAGPQDATYTVKFMTPETALAAAQAALKQCRGLGYQVSVAVVDRSGVAQVMLRDRFAGVHTVRTATGKAWTAASFRTSTADMVGLTQAGKPENGVRHLPGVVMLGGGLPIESGGTLVGAIGVSGAPGGAEDERCAKAGVDAIREALEL